jgi:predicted HAD superfamily Cof-like phosphohydrolase
MKAQETFDPETAVAEFMRTFEASLDIRLWVKLVREEIDELLDAMRSGVRADVLKELIDVVYVVAGTTLVEPVSEAVPPAESAEWDYLMNEAADTVGHAVDTFGFKPNILREAFYRVHHSNMSKLGEDGKPIRREDGKIMKGPNYAPPVLTDLV